MRCSVGVARTVTTREQNSPAINPPPPLSLHNLSASLSTGHVQDGKLQPALEGFQKVLSMQGDTKGEWGFKALKQMVKALFRQVPPRFQLRDEL